MNIKMRICCVFPSLIEGFGIPLIEAMNYCLPIISSNKTVLPEILGDAGILIDPSPENIAEKIEYLINNPTIAQIFVERGLKRKDLFSDDIFINNIIQFYSHI